MTWQESVFALFEDLEQQAEGLALVERDLEVADLSATEYARVTFAARLRASLDQALRIRLHGGLSIGGELVRVGDDWILLVDRPAEWIVRMDAVASVTGLSARARSDATGSVVDRLSIRVVLRRLAADGDACVVHFVDDQRSIGRVGRVGQDFVELHVGERPTSTVQVVPLRTIAALQRPR